MRLISFCVLKYDSKDPLFLVRCHELGFMRYDHNLSSISLLITMYSAFSKDPSQKNILTSEPELQLRNILPSRVHASTNIYFKDPAHLTKAAALILLK